MLPNCASGEDFRKSLRLPGDQSSQSQRKPTLNIPWKNWCWNWSSNTLATWSGRADSLEKTLMVGKTEGKRRKGQQRMRWLVSITDSVDMNLSKIMKGQGAWHATVHGVAKSWTWLSNWTTTAGEMTMPGSMPFLPSTLSPYFPHLPFTAFSEQVSYFSCVSFHR